MCVWGGGEGEWENGEVIDQGGSPCLSILTQTSRLQSIIITIIIPFPSLAKCSHFKWTSRNPVEEGLLEVAENSVS